MKQTILMAAFLLACPLSAFGQARDNAPGFTSRFVAHGIVSNAGFGPASATRLALNSPSIPSNPSGEPVRLSAHSGQRTTKRPTACGGVQFRKQRLERKCGRKSSHHHRIRGIAVVECCGNGRYTRCWAPLVKKQGLAIDLDAASGYLSWMLRRDSGLAQRSGWCTARSRRKLAALFVKDRERCSSTITCRA